MNYKENWDLHSQMAIDHWGSVKNNPTADDLLNEENFKSYLMSQYGWDEDRAREELKWFSDFSRTFESK